MRTIKRASTALRVAMRPVRGLAPRPGNPRKHSRAQIRQIARSVEEFGFNNPILVDQEGLVVAGHGRLEAAKMLGLGEVPTIRLDHMSPAQLRGYVLADNRLAEHSAWDRDLLTAEFEFLTGQDLEFDLTTTGFGTGEIDLFLESGQEAEPEGPEDDIPGPGQAGPAVSRPGDLWELGEHRLYCGDALDPVSLAKLLGRRRADVVFTDPPYNVPVDGHVCGSGVVRHREFAMASGEMSPEQFCEFLAQLLEQVMRVSKDGAILFVCMDWRHMWELTSAARKAGAALKNVVVWKKDNAGMGSLYRSQHELVFVLKNGQRSHVNNVELGRFGRYRTNVWEYPGVNSLRKGRRADLELHPTVKPVALVADAISDCSNRGAIVLDCFAGSGTTLLAAQKTSRRGYLVELDPLYVDVAIRRFEKHVGVQAVLSGTGQTFEDVAAERVVRAASGARQRRSASKRRR